MTTATMFRSEAEAVAVGFGQLVHAEWTKFRSVRGWLVGMFVAALLTVGLGLFAAANAGVGCQINGGAPRSGKACLPYIPHGPGGEVVSDSFYFLHQPLTGDGSITARVISLTGMHANLNGGRAQANSGPNLVPGLAPWSKAGIIIKENTRQGSAYAAMLVTGGNGVRMQYDYTGDTAGLPGNVSAASPRWLRLTRSGNTITGYDSTDGRHWAMVGAVQLPGLTRQLQIGMFATSPNYTVTSRSFGGTSNMGGPSQATGVFDHVRVTGATAGTWAGAAIGGGGPIGIGGPGASGGSGPPAYREAHGTFTVTGSGDIAPAVPGPGSGYPTATVEQALVGTFIGLIAIVVVAAMFFTVEYRRGLIRTTLAATPRRGHVLAAKAVVIGLVAFVVGLVASTVAITVGVPMMTNGGQVVLPVSVLTEARVVIGTAALLAVAAVFAVALGAIVRRSAAAITIAIVMVALPFLLVALNVFPAGVGTWILRLTPAAGLAIQQSIPQYAQVTTVTSPAGGYFPLPPFAGLAVLCAWAAAALWLAVVLLRRRDT